MRLDQRLVQSPQMIQAMQILQLSALDLEGRVEQELTENPLLERQETAAEPSESADAGEALAAANEAAPETDGLQHMLDELERYDRDFGDGTRSRAPRNEDGDKKYEALQNAPELPASLPMALLGQLGILHLTPHRHELIEYLIWSLDERGYLRDSLEDLAAQLSAGHEEVVAVEELESALAKLRMASHPAMGARDLRECLLLQIEDDPHEALLHALINDHLPDLEANRLPRIAKATGRTIDEVKEAIETIRTLDPIPGAEYGSSLASVITPDVIVEESEGEYIVRLERERQPRLTVNPAYRQMLQQARNDPSVRDWVKKRLESARWFIDALQQRQSTLQRIADSVFQRQRKFLDQGISGLQPLRMQEVADEIGVHISTVSRGVAGKYAQTPRGIFAMKFFFTGGTAKSSGEVTSQVSIKERIRELVAAEDHQKPYSDDQLAAQLLEKDGIRIARRTVTKYRKALDLPSSSQRRAY